MAEYIKFRLTAAKVGVSMALLALIAGVAEKARSGPAQVTATPAANFLKLGGLTSAIGGNFQKVEAKIVKIDSALAKIEKKIDTAFYDRRTINADFLKIKDANKKYLTIADGSAKFLTITDANAKFLPSGGTAVDSAEPGGQTPGAFVQGHANVVSGAATIAAGGAEQTLLPVPSATQGAIIVVCEPAPGGGVNVVFRNGTNLTLPAVQRDAAGLSHMALPPGDTTIGTFAGGEVNELQMQTFPVAGFNNVMTLTVSLEPSSTNPNQTAVVGQLLTGGI